MEDGGFTVRNRLAGVFRLDGMGLEVGGYECDGDGDGDVSMCCVG